MGIETTARPKRVDNVRAGLASRQRLVVAGPRRRSPPSAVPVRRVRVALRAGLAATTVPGPVAVGAGPLAAPLLDLPRAAVGPVAADAVAEEGELRPVLEVTVAVDRARVRSADEAKWAQASQGGLPRRAEVDNRQVLVELLA